MEATELRRQALDSSWDMAGLVNATVLPFSQLVVMANPVGERQTEIRPVGAASTTSAATARGTILILDDEGDIVESYRRLIERLFPEVTVRTATKPERALELLRREPVNVIISDYRMPGMDGLEFLAAARSIQPQAHRLLLTAYLNEELEGQVDARAAPAACLSKAASLDALVERIQNELSGAR